MLLLISSIDQHVTDHKLLIIMSLPISSSDQHVIANDQVKTLSDISLNYSDVLI